MALDSSTEVLYVANLNSGTVDTINASSETRNAGFLRVFTAPLGIVYVPADNQVDVTDENFGTVSVLANAPEIAQLSANPNPTEPGVPTYIEGLALNGTAPYTYSFSNAPSGCTSAGLLRLNCTVQTPGIYRIYFNVTDSIGYPAWSILRLYVNASFGGAVLGAAPPVLDVGQPLQLSLNVSGGTLPLSFEYYGLPAGCASNDSPTVVCMPRSAGTFDVTARVIVAVGG
ncbi:MAG: hypothetical protein L3J96_01790, partial [Thermoplasmata archaeon]|nr:hypothetical protein [Thermoplasmata archaeon]